MPQMIPTLPGVLLALLTLSTGTYVLLLVLFKIGSREMLRLDAPSEAGYGVDPSAPGVTILKPCAGAADDLDACLESYYRLDYPNYQIVFGVRSVDDLAYPVVCAAAARHPERQTDIVLTQAGRSVNLKIASFEVMLPRARHALLLLSDSGTVAHPDTLSTMVKELHSPGIGAVVSPIVGVGASSSGAWFDNLAINTALWMGTLGIYVLIGRAAGLGKSVLLRRKDLEAVGLETMGRSFGDDEVLISGLVALGHKVVFGRRAVGSFMRDATLRRACARHLRWQQIRWTIAPLGSSLYEAIMSPMIPALALAAAAPSDRHWLMLAAACGLQAVGDGYVFWRMRGELPPLPHLGMVLARPLISFAIWMRASVDRRVSWHGHTFYMGPGATVLQLPAQAAADQPPECATALPAERE
jgi:ceramide glucosyltransferase